MNKIFIICLVVICWVNSTAYAQSPAWQALNYQAVALDASGQPIKNREVSLLVYLSSEDKAKKPFFIENHQVTTDETGAFQIKIGRGKSIDGEWTLVPWAQESIWLRIEMASSNNRSFDLVSDKQLLAVPFAFHAKTASKLLEPNPNNLEKNQSIYWTTSGNTNTRPATHFIGTTDNKNLTFRSNNIPHMTLTTQGKLELISRVPAGSDKNKDFYPMVVEGTQNIQGMWIKVKGAADTSNNFMTFVDDKGIQGRIEGQTLSQLEQSETYQTQVALVTLTSIQVAAEIAALGVEAPVKLGSGSSTAAGVAAILKMGAQAIKLESFIIKSVTWFDAVRSKVGVTFSSGSGDYAEWLPRNTKERDLSFGEVVGVKNGQISLNTTAADHLLVVSKAPIVLGNAPQPDQEYLYEKVAFMGQVPVKVAGPVAVNDFIIPSGNNDGFAIAVHPENMKTLDYGKILGVAWEAAEDLPINIVNVAVGLNSNDLAKRVQILNEKVEQIEAYLSGKNSTLLTKSIQENKTSFTKKMSDVEFDQFVDQNANQINESYRNARLELQSKNFDFNSIPGLSRLFDNPIEEIKRLRRDPTYTTQWGMIDQKIPSKK